MRIRLSLLAIVLACIPVMAQEEHNHPVPEKLGSVSFPTSCSKAVQPQFERAVALLHSFAYTEAEKAFHVVAASDPKCAMAHWGVAMSFYHQLWESRISAEDVKRAQDGLAEAQKLEATPRERQFISAIGLYYQDADKLAPQARAAKYKDAMAEVARANPSDAEAQVFYALALLGTASPMDKTHANQKQAVDILEPLYKRYPQHPGIAHYIIHSCDSSEMAKRGLYAAREYSKIAPSAPHALHMPSHIFTRLGYWDDSIASNLSARDAAHKLGDIGEELHAMDYLAYAYLQRGQDDKVAALLEDLRTKPELRAGDFKVGYAATAMRVRYAVERGRWNDAANIQPMAGASPQVAAIAYWARALGFARSGKPDAAVADIAKLRECAETLKASGNAYWATQTHVLLLEAQAWNAQAGGKSDEALSLLRSAADEEDAVEKLPVTPGPIVPAREQLAELMLALKRPDQSLREYEAALALAPNRRGSLRGAATASDLVGDKKKAREFSAALD